VVIDLSIEPEQLHGWGSAAVAAHKAQVAGARALVVASPTYKAAYTGLLKLFLDQFGAGELGGVPTVAVMTGGSPAHSLAVDVHLAPVLVEIGASLPARGVYVSGPDVDQPADAIDAWWAAAQAPLRRALGRTTTDG
jgi:FMN reductase